MNSSRASPVLPVVVACFGIALFASMDAAMKGLSIAMGAYNATLWRVGIGGVMSAGPYLIWRKRWPSRAGLRIHFIRGAVSAVMAVSFFYGIARVPLTEGIALSFIAPLIALYLAAVVLGEAVGRHTIFASMLGVGGVAVMLVARAGLAGDRHLDGVLAILVSAVLYAWNIILMRQQAQLASPLEVAFVQNVTAGSVLMLAAPFWAAVPAFANLPMLGLAAALAFASLFLLSWAYGRAEAQMLVPVEYTAFVWAAIMGAIFYGESLTLSTLGGTLLIVTGCIVAARGGRSDTARLEAAA